ncbi:MAG: Hsp20/alpha crystallin family protein [Candidatus Lokiarchaeota archaeon]|nr:Hsp20/alpha crystallin family protein [Candidatus Lokiarchaeota archaeon]
MCDERHHGSVHGPKGMYGCFSFTPRDVARMRRMAHHFMGNFMGSYIPHNVEDLGDSYLITVPLPGRTKEEVSVSLLDKNLNISAKKPKVPESENKESKKEGQECCSPWKGFTFIDVNMDIPLPSDADENTITSKMANGLLRISMGKKPAKNINIGEEGSN